MGGLALHLAQRPGAQTVTNRLKKGRIKVGTHIYQRREEKEEPKGVMFEFDL